MAQPGQNFVYICRNCRRNISSSSWAKSARSFSTTRSRSKVIPSFNQTSNPEFDDLLLTWRQKVFMPAALENHHRDLIYKASRHGTLTKEPGVTVTMDDDEKIQLEPIHFYDKPNVHKSILKLVKFLGRNHNDTDWDNLPPFLHGSVMAKIKLPSRFYQQITRKACEVGKERIILRCAEKPSETGVKLSREGVARELMLGFHNRAALANFQGGELEAASRRAEYVARMLEDEEHGGGKLTIGEVDARKDPVVLAVLLELAAAKAVYAHGGQDLEGKVANYATKLLHLGRQSLHSHLERQKEVERTNLALAELLPVQNAMKWALKIESVKNAELGKQLQAELSGLTRVVESTVQSIREKAGDKSRRSLIMYDQLREQEQKTAS
ncbi:uncharacterized protein Z520_10097 [Fonsecaea multimorphosa CBS 102226]|uniref:Uncharacterized protein n=1 Tax=Fonsecaea multimorphosa CBS 102226 TaxID=1442371 RepID=A0A0D2IA93_9EURO|nr:uncharacterized protein Z520_10097 [Fonsecaea multimorphosa CBS 102226]KIX94071.1 hypothetical protein Z520_10097 [Fonsecaea multimorphosa CBS 102226]OAL19424.1 hypothetical protein AYO22_09586 [Fonsecaea multimorphosa]